MKKRILAGLMTIVMLFTVLPLNVFAGGVDSVVWASTYDELVAALANPKVSTLYIAAQHPAKDENGNIIMENGASVMEPFTWPEGECTLDLESSNLPYVAVSGDWVIPENVTVNHNLTVAYPDDRSSITCNGTWNRLSKDSKISSLNDFTLNGLMTVPTGTYSLLADSNGGAFYLNGELRLPDNAVVIVDKLILGDGALISGSYLSAIEFYGGYGENLSGIYCPSGKATIEAAVNIFSYEETPLVLSGNIDMSCLRLNYPKTMVIEEGSHITLKALDGGAFADNGGSLIIKGHLDLNAEREYHLSDYASIVIEEGGVLTLRAGNHIGNYKYNRSTISGNGTVKLYADIDDSGKPVGNIASLYEEITERPEPVAETITIWRSWLDSDCQHEWGAPETIPPTCCSTGSVKYACTLCGVKKIGEKIPATGEHEFSYKPLDGYTDRLLAICENERVGYTIKIVAEDAEYNGGKPVETACISGPALALNPAPTIVYTNNAEPGTATASATIGGITIFTTFEIKAPASASNVIGVEAIGSGCIYDKERNGYFANFTTLKSIFSGEPYHIQSVDSRAWYTSDNMVPANQLTTDPKPGESYYFNIRLSQSGIDFTNVTAENCIVSLDGFDTEITAVDTGTDGLAWITVKATTEIKAPTVKVSGISSTGKNKVSWGAVDGAVEYKVYRATSKTGNYSLKTTTASLSWTDTTAKAGTTYYYKVKACGSNGAADSAYSAIVSRTCDLARPVVTTSNVASSGKIKLSWDAIDGAAKYQVYRATSKNGEYTSVKTTTGTSYTNTSAVAGKTYYYKVVAVHSNSAANSAYSEIKSRTCDLPQPVVTASNVASSGKIQLTWKKIDGAVEYKVYRATSKTGEYKLMKTTTETSYTNTSAVVGKTYYYKVVAVHSNSAANSTYSEIKSRTCDLPRTVVTASNVASSGKIKLTWKKIDGAAQYKVYRATSKTGEYTLMKTTTETSYTNTSAVAGKAYYYKVVAVHANSAANSTYSEVKSRTCDLARPVVSISLNTSGKPVISWKAISGAEKYTVYMYDASGKLLKPASSSGTKLTHSSATKGNTYTHKVVAVHSNTSANSAKSSGVSMKSK